MMKVFFPDEAEKNETAIQKQPRPNLFQEGDYITTSCGIIRKVIAVTKERYILSKSADVTDSWFKERMEEIDVDRYDLFGEIEMTYHLDRFSDEYAK